MPAWNLSLLRASLLQTASTVTSVYNISNVWYYIFSLRLPAVLIWTPYCPWIRGAIFQQPVLSVSYLVHKLCQEIHILCLHSSSLQWKFDWTTRYHIVSWLSWAIPKQSQLSVEDPCQWGGRNTGTHMYSKYIIYWFITMEYADKLGGCVLLYCHCLLFRSKWWRLRLNTTGTRWRFTMEETWQLPN